MASEASNTPSVPQPLSEPMVGPRLYTLDEQRQLATLVEGLGKQLALAENALRAIIRNADCYGYDVRSSEYVLGLHTQADVARRYEAAADGVFV